MKVLPKLFDHSDKTVREEVRYIFRRNLAANAIIFMEATCASFTYHVFLFNFSCSLHALLFDVLL